MHDERCFMRSGLVVGQRRQMAPTPIDASACTAAFTADDRLSSEQYAGTVGQCGTSEAARRSLRADRYQKSDAKS
jgi:hypothetical protein